VCVILGAALIGAACLAAAPAFAQPDLPPGTPPAMTGMAARLSAERVGPVAPGLYGAGDTAFVLSAYPGGKYLLRFAGAPESFVLTVDRASLGAKLLKYDTGATALRVSVWGGLTLYTADRPGGIPATRQGEAPVAQALAISEPELATAFHDEARHLTYTQKIALTFSADPSVLSADPETRGRAFDALTNAARGIEQFVAGPAGRMAFTHRVHEVKVTEGAKPTVVIAGQTLLVSFVPGEGHEGHASSLAIQQELGKLFSVTPKDVATK
jgi:hypothetical protein